jgi:ankyrin repeat protein
MALLQLLMGKDVNIAATDNYGRTALDHAASRGHAEAVKLLLDANADVNAQDEDGWTALHRAARSGNAEA